MVVRRVLLPRAMHRIGWVIGSSFAIAGAVFACGSARMPAPSYVQHPSSALLPAQYPPPPARVEFVPEEPKASGAVWIDGEWTWQGRRWAWKQGRWVVPPANASYAPWTMTRDALGNVYVAEGRWRGAKGEELDDPKPLALGQRSAGTVVDPEGEEVPAGPNVPGQTPAKKPNQPSGTEQGPPETPSHATPTGTQEEGPSAADGGTPEAGFKDVAVSDALARPDALPLGAEPAKTSVP